MRRAICMAFVLLAGLSLAFAEEKKPDDPRVVLVEKASRVRQLSAALASSVVTVRVCFRAEPDGTYPDVKPSYVCPVCGSGWKHASSISDSVEKDLPLVMTGFVLAPDRVLVQDLSLRASWVSRIEVSTASGVCPAKPLARYPEANGLVLATEKPLVGVTPLAFTGAATNAPALFHLVDEVDGRRLAGLRDISKNVRCDVRQGRMVVDCTPNTFVVDASNRVVTIALRREIPLEGNDLWTPPAAWTGEPAEALEARIQKLEKNLQATFLPVYLHIEEEKKSNGRSFVFSSFDERKLTGDIDATGLALPDGEVLVCLALDSSKVAGLDKMEATLPDGAKAPLDFVGAFPDHAAFLLKFRDGKTPPGVRPATFYVPPATQLARERIYALCPANRNGRMRLSLVPHVVGDFKRARGGIVVPSALNEEVGNFLVRETGEIVAFSVQSRQGQRSWQSRAALSGAAAAQLVAAHDFDPEYAVRKGKDRIRIAWIGVEAQAMTPELAREKKAQGFLEAAGEFGEPAKGALVGKVYPGTPAARAGVKEGDVLLWVRRAKGQRREKLEARDARAGMDFMAVFERVPLSLFDRYGLTPWPEVEGGVNETFTRLGIGTKVVLAWVQDGEKREAELMLEQAPVHHRTAKRVRNRQLGLVAADLTFEVRAYLKLADDAPGVVIAKMQEGSPAAVAGLRPCEVITEVDGQPVAGVIAFADMIRDKRALTFSVRRLDATRIVQIRLGDGK